MYEFDSSGRFVNADRQLRHSVNNNNINKIKLTHFGVFVGLSREVRLLNHYWLNSTDGNTKVNSAAANRVIDSASASTATVTRAFDER